MKKFKFFGDDYLDAIDLLDTLPRKVVNSLRYHKILPFPNEDIPWYLWKGFSVKYREAIGHLCALDFFNRHKEEYEKKYEYYDKSKQNTRPKDSMFQ